MIISISSSLPTFKTVTFHQGLNVVLSTKAPGSNEKQTRNSAGKTSLIEIIHFLLGGKADPDSLPRHKALAAHTFKGRFLIGGWEVDVARSGSKVSRVFIDEGSAKHFGLATKKDKESGAEFVSNEEWKDFLAHRFFDFPAVVKGSPFEESYTPSFRALFAYFAALRIGRVPASGETGQGPAALGLAGKPVIPAGARLANPSRPAHGAAAGEPTGRAQEGSQGRSARPPDRNGGGALASRGPRRGQGNQAARAARPVPGS
ncbi:hypothetical protein ACD578_17475 [Microvirga sp. RSM25]|uniref:hypothetical protein n=1 Tax=Microvirga sp. RSM25 TaxID=3273802 RepID=UPI0038516C5B